MTGEPSDIAVLRSVVAGSGGDAEAVKPVTIGFDAVAALLSGRVAAATAFWNDEGVMLQRRRPGFHVFRVEGTALPPTRSWCCARRARTCARILRLADAVVHALVRGYGPRCPTRGPRARPRAPGAGRRPGAAGGGAAAVSPAFRAPDGRVGELVLRRCGVVTVEVRFGIVSRPPDVSVTFDRGFVAAAGPG